MKIKKTVKASGQKLLFILLAFTGWCCLAQNWATPQASDMDYTVKNGRNYLSMVRGVNRNVHIPKSWKKDDTEETITIQGIAASAFKDNETITGIQLDDGIEYLEDGAFQNCSKLSLLDNYQQLKYIGNNTFAGTALTSFAWPSGIDPDENGVRWINEGVFNGCKSLASITIPNNVTVIGANAFKGTALVNFTVPATVKQIGDNAFMGSQLKSIVFARGQKLGNGVLHDCTSLTSVTLPPDMTAIPDGTFRNCSALNSSVLTDNITEIGVYAFYECTSLKAANAFSTKLATIGDYAYSKSGIEKVDATQLISLVNLGTHVFESCASLTDVNLPTTLETIPDYAFASCTALVDCILKDKPIKHIGESAFYGCTKLTDVEEMKNVLVLPPSLTSIEVRSFNNCTSIKNVKFQTSTDGDGNEIGVTVLPAVLLNGTYYGVFGGCTALEHVELPKTLNQIGSYTFRNCSSLKGIIVPENVTAIEVGAFFNCNKLLYVSLNDKLKTIGRNAFDECSSLEDVVIPASVTSVGSNAFARCTNLSSVTVPDTTKCTINDSAFWYCSKLKTIYAEGGRFNSTNTSDGDAWFFGSNNLGIKKIYAYDNTTPRWNEYFSCSDSKTTIPVIFRGQNLTLVAEPDNATIADVEDEVNIELHYYYGKVSDKDDITTRDSSYEIHYSLDGSVPTTSAESKYTGPITLTADTVVKARVYKNISGIPYAWSPIITKRYKLVPKNYSVTTNASCEVVGDTTEYPKGATVKVQAIAPAGFTTDDYDIVWDVYPEPEDGFAVIGDAITFTMPKGNVTVSATLTDRPTRLLITTTETEVPVDGSLTIDCKVDYATGKSASVTAALSLSENDKQAGYSDYAEFDQKTSKIYNRNTTTQDLSVTVVATYGKLVAEKYVVLKKSYYPLTVTGTADDGEKTCKKGTPVELTAAITEDTAPADYSYQWTVEGVDTLTDEQKTQRTISFDMPEKAVTASVVVTALLKEVKIVGTDTIVAIDEKGDIGTATYSVKAIFGDGTEATGDDIPAAVWVWDGAAASSSWDEATLTLTNTNNDNDLTTGCAEVTGNLTATLTIAGKGAAKSDTKVVTLMPKYRKLTLVGAKGTIDDGANFDQTELAVEAGQDAVVQADIPAGKTADLYHFKWSAFDTADAEQKPLDMTFTTDGADSSKVTLTMPANASITVTAQTQVKLDGLAFASPAADSSIAYGSMTAATIVNATFADETSAEIAPTKLYLNSSAYAALVRDTTEAPDAPIKHFQIVNRNKSNADVVVTLTAEYTETGLPANIEPITKIATVNVTLQRKDDVVVSLVDDADNDLSTKVTELAYGASLTPVAKGTDRDGNTSTLTGVTLSAALLKGATGTVTDYLTISGMTLTNVNKSQAPVSVRVTATSDAGVTKTFDVKLLPMGQLAFGLASSDLGGTGLELDQEFTVDLMVTAGVPFYAGDVIVQFDSSVLELVYDAKQTEEQEDVVDENGFRVPDAQKLISEDYNGLCAASIVAKTVDGKVVADGIRLGGSHKALMDSTLPKPTASDTPFVYATLTFKVRADAAVPATGKTVLTVTNDDDASGFAVGGNLLIAWNSDTVSYGNLDVPLATPEVFFVTITANKTSIAQDESFGLTATLTSANEKELICDVTVTVAAKCRLFNVKREIVIPAGDKIVTVDDFMSAAEGTVDPADSLTGDLTIACNIIATDVDYVHFDETDVVEVACVDSDCGLTVQAFAWDGETYQEVTNVVKGMDVVFVATLPEGITAYGATDLAFTLGGTMVQDEDYTVVEQNTTIAADGSSVELVKVHFSDSLSSTNEETLIVTVTGLSSQDGAVVYPFSAFTETSAQVVAVRYGDISGGDDGEGDGTIDFKDLVVLISNMDVTDEDDNWDQIANCDLNGDGIIDYRDIVILISMMDETASRRAKRSATRGDVPHTIELTMTADKQLVQPGDVVTVTIWAESNFTDYPVASIGCGVNWSAADVAWNGDFNPADVINEGFDLMPLGTLRDDGTGISNLVGITVNTPFGMDGEPFVFATLTLKVKEASTASEIVISLDNLVGGTKGGGYSTARNTMTMTAKPLALPVGVINKTYELTAGWNLIGLPFEITADSKTFFADLTVMLCDPVTGAYVDCSSDEMAMGNCYWVFVPQDKIPMISSVLTIVVAAAGLPETTAVQLNRGWNWVTPKFSADQPLNPLTTTDAIQQMWYYTPNGYRQVTEDTPISAGEVYYILSDENTTIW